MYRSLIAALAALMLAQPLAAQQIYTAEPSAAQLQQAEILLVDIRQPHEWVETGVLPNALLLPFDSPAQFLDALAPHLQPGQPVALICRTGNRTAQAAQIIAPALDVPVIDLGGGMFRLLRAGYQPTRPTRAQGCTIC
ncbi:MAG: rhodanese-like domain-containing protein [Roseinatronobacter sp.]|nr:rhodanese-like domain-containing protein [Roseinatronobacter sp.]